MAKRASRRRGKIFVDGLDFKRFVTTLGKALEAEYQLSLETSVVMEVVAKAAGFKSMRDLALEADRSVHEVAPVPDQLDWVQEPLAFKKLGRKYLLPGARLKTAREQLHAAIGDARLSSALVVAVLGASREVRQQVVEDVAKQAEAVVFDLGIVTTRQLAAIDQTTKRVVVLDGIRVEDGSSFWAIDFARRHREKIVVLLVDQGDHHQLVSLNNDQIYGPRGWRINFLDLDRPVLEWSWLTQAPASAKPVSTHAN